MHLKLIQLINIVNEFFDFSVIHSPFRNCELFPVKHDLKI